MELLLEILVSIIIEPIAALLEAPLQRGLDALGVEESYKKSRLPEWAKILLVVLLTMALVVAFVAVVGGVVMLGIGETPDEKNVGIILMSVGLCGLLGYIIWGVIRYCKNKKQARATESIKTESIKTFYSYVMGIDESVYDLTAQGFCVEDDGSNFTVTFPANLAPVWEDFISQRLEVGYWNEYIADDRVIFLFNLPDGIKRYEVVNFQNDEVLHLCEELCNCVFPSLKEMLCDNHFYAQIIK